MFIEADVEYYGAKPGDEYEVTLGIELEMTDDQIKRFNEEHKDTFIVRGTGKSYFAPGEPYLWFVAVDQEADPSENFAPFGSIEEASKSLNEVWTFCGRKGKPNIRTTCKDYRY